MKIVLLVISVLVLSWGVWIVSTNQSEQSTQTGLQACDKTFSSSDPTSSSGNHACSASTFKSSKDLDRNAIIAIVVGGIFTLGLSVSIKDDLL